MFRSILTLSLLGNLNSSPVTSFEPPSANTIELVELNPLPTLKKGALAPLIEAKSGLLMDNKTGMILYEKNAYEPLPMASITKIMTALLILENHDLDERVPIKSDFTKIEGVKIYLHQGEEMTVENLLKALLLPSAGDAALALAEYDSGTVDAFVKKMNQRAKELNLNQTHFLNPIGLDEKGHVSTAYDLAQLSRYAMHFPAFQNMVNLSSAQISSVDGNFTYDLKSTDDLLGSYLNVVGIKTGTTDEAGESVINLARNEAGHEVLSVVLNSPNRFQESKSMLDWAFRSYLW